MLCVLTPLKNWETSVQNSTSYLSEIFTEGSSASLKRDITAQTRQIAFLCVSRYWATQFMIRHFSRNLHVVHFWFIVITVLRCLIIHVLRSLCVAIICGKVESGQATDEKICLHAMDALNILVKGFSWIHVCILVVKARIFMYILIFYQAAWLTFEWQNVSS